MPGIILFGRRWRFASDDFFIPATAGFLIRVVGSLLIALSLSTADFSHCAKGHKSLPYVYLWGFLLIALLLCVLHAFEIFISIQGLVFETKKRHSLNFVVYLTIFVCVLELVWSIIGTIAYDSLCDHEEGSGKIYFFVVVLWSWLTFLTAIITAIFLFDPAGHLTYGMGLEYKYSWESQCRFVCCFTKSANNKYQDIAQIISNLILTADLVPSDVIAALILMNESHELKKDQVCKSAIPLDYRNEKDVQDLDDLTHYARYALGAYGYRIFMLNNFACGLCQMGVFKSDFGRKPFMSSKIFNDDWCQCNYRASQEMAGFKDEDIVHYNALNDVFKSPYFVAIDKTKRKVVISIRGSCSMQDFLTDMCATYSLLDVPGVCTGYVHDGILETAQYILEDLEMHSVLDLSFSFRNNYDLVIVGHSLGAAIAVLLGLFLRKKYPNLFVYAYSPPGGLMSKELAHFCEQFCISFICGSDLVPRLSHHTLHQIRDKIMSTLHHCNRPKYQIFGYKIFKSLIGRYLPVYSSVPEDEYSEERDPENICSPLIDHQSGSNDKFSIDLTVKHIPGRILHAIKSGEDDGYKSFWVEDCEDFNELLITGTMVSDHLPENNLSTLEALLNE